MMSEQEPNKLSFPFLFDENAIAIDVEMEIFRDESPNYKFQLFKFYKKLDSVRTN